MTNRPVSIEQGAARHVDLADVDFAREGPEIMNVQEAADFLRVSPITVRAMLAEQLMPGKRMGKEWRLSRTALIQWLSEPGERKNYPKRRPVGI